MAASLVAYVALATASLFPLSSSAVGISASDIRSAILLQLENERGDYRVSVNELGGDNRDIDIRGEEAVEPASSIKVFYAWVALRQVDRETISLTSRLASGTSWGKCLTVMIEVSDNLCSADIREALGNRFLNRTFARAGFGETRILLNGEGEYVGKRTSTSDLTDLMSRLEAGTLLSSDSTSHLHRLLRNQMWRSRIAGGTPAGVVVESKPGVLAVNDRLVQSDTAIVRGPNSTYVLSIIGTNNATKVAFRHISRIVYEGLQGQTGYIAATYPKQQFTVAAGTDFRTTYGGSVTAKIPTTRAVELKFSSRREMYVNVPGYGWGWVNWSRLTLRPEFRWIP
jgi:beta-lactamase class A